MRELTANAIRQAKARKHKTRRRIMYAAAGIVVLMFGIWLLFIPFKGDMRYGVCRTFLELNTSMPTTLRLTGLDDYNSQMRIWFTSTNPFGQYRLDSITCFFKEESSAPEGFDLKSVQIGQRPVDQNKVDEFNKTIDAVYAGKPSLVLPAPLPDALSDMQIDPTRYYRITF